jgi:hypothetical protein
MNDIAPVIVSLGFFAVLLGGFVIFGPIGRAFAERLRVRSREAALDTGELDALREELSSVRRQVAELAERQDFTERLLAQVRERGLLAAPKER